MGKVLRAAVCLSLASSVFFFGQKPVQAAECLSAGLARFDTTCAQLMLSPTPCCDGLLCTDSVGAYRSSDTNLGQTYDPNVKVATCQKSPQEEAYDLETQRRPRDTVIFKPQIGIPGSITLGGRSFSVRAGEGLVITGDTLARWLALFYQFFIAMLAVVSVVMLMWGGFKRIMAAGSPEAMKGANETVAGALVGLILALVSYSLLSLINPKLVSFKTLEIEPITAVPFSFRPALVENPTLLTKVDQYAAEGCPSTQELEQGVGFFATGYYKPSYGDRESYQSFECNIAMQCSCPAGREAEKSCVVTAKNGEKRAWWPCKAFSATTPYCNKTSTGLEPVALKTAATSRCLPKGTVFKVFGSLVSEANQAVWYAQDSGGWINGRRVDLFFGQGSDAYRQAVRNTGEITIKVCPGNSEANCPTS